MKSLAVSTALPTTLGRTPQNRRLPLVVASVPGRDWSRVVQSFRPKSGEEMGTRWVLRGDSVQRNSASAGLHSRLMVPRGRVRLLSCKQSTGLSENVENVAATNLRRLRHLKTLSGEKPKKIKEGEYVCSLQDYPCQWCCNQCDFASSETGNLRTHT